MTIQVLQRRVDWYIEAGFRRNLLSLLWRWRQPAPPERWYLSTNQHGIMFQKTWPFMSTTVRTSDLAWRNYRCLQAVAHETRQVKW